ncbi:MAG TPA: hypothetical protein VNO18_14855 [Xanthobacteraceae bacterium]|jgi:hypothetical protein|nr:hypothetical protein [Xanthobacteraceae bacterium]
MTIAALRPARKHIWLSNAGLLIMAVAFAWWFLFYAQWTGPLRLLDLKVPCLVTTIDECSFFQSRLEEFHASGPVYQPAVWWIGMATFLVGRASGKLFPGKLPDRAGLGRDGKQDGVRQ